MKTLKDICITDIPFSGEKKEGTLYLTRTAAGCTVGNYLIENPELTDWEYLEKVYNRICGEPLEIAQTDRIIVREPVLADASDLYRIMQLPEVNRFVDDFPANYADFCEKLDAYRTAFDYYDCGFWSIIEKNSGRLIGRCGIQYSTIDTEILPELGFFLDPDFEGKGYAYEASLVALDYAYDYLGEDVIYARVKPENLKSVRLLERLGFEKNDLKIIPENIILYNKFRPLQGKEK